MKKYRLKYIIGIVFILMMLALPFIPAVKQYMAIPTHLKLYPDDVATLNVSAENNGLELVTTADQNVVEVENNTIKSTHTGVTELTYQYKNVPLKKITVNVDEPYQVIPGGQSIGINLETLGVLVVGHHQLNENDKGQSPGKDIGIEIGDSILEMNQQKIQSIEDISPIVTEAGEKQQTIEVKYKRGTKTYKEQLTPVFDQQSESYKIGLYIRDSAAGIGTMTFYDPLTNKYGALGHVISDMDTKEPIEINSGSIVRSKITSIKKGDTGTPGEKRASFNQDEGLLGNIMTNSAFGVFGDLNTDITDYSLAKPLPIANVSEVKEGPGQILTVINDEEIETFDIEIISVIDQKNPATKGMVLRITDQRLLDETGGIVQGMSGSPIIQDDKIVGAVTHVFVNDPTSGYGIHIEWMLNEAGIDYKNTSAQAS